MSVPAVSPDTPPPGAPTPGSPTRRRVLASAGIYGAVAAGVAGCGFLGAGKQQDEPPAGPLTLGPAADVPVGGGTIYRTERVVVTQPSAGTYEAFSAVCTHAGCLVTSVAENLIHCDCHGSSFSASDGAVVQGPATTPLPRVELTVQGADLVAG